MGETNVATQVETTAATYEQLKAALPTADASFICDQLDAKATVDQARGAFMAECDKRVAIAEAKAKELEAKPQPAPGVDPLSAGGSGTITSDGDAVALWHEAVAAEVAQGKTKAKAISSTAKKNPDLHTAYVRAVNLDHKRPLGRFA